MCSLAVRFDEHVPTTTEFAEEMDELLFWLDETENILDTNVRPAHETFMEDMLEKIKVSAQGAARSHCTHGQVQ